MEIRIYQTDTGAVIEYPEWMTKEEALERAYAALKQK